MVGVSSSGTNGTRNREADEMADLVFRELCVVHVLFEREEMVSKVHRRDMVRL